MASERGRARLSTPPAPLMAFERELFLRSIGGAMMTRGVAAQQLARAMRDVSFRAGETIYRAGDFTRLVHFVTHGEVELATEGSETWRLVAPAIIGVLDVNMRRPFSRTATALTDVRALVLGADDWFEALDDNFEYASGAVLRLCADVHRLHLTISPGGGFHEPPPQSDDDAHALNVQERTLALRLVSCFQFAGIQALAMLAISAEERSLGRGQRLFTVDEPAPSFFVVARGTIRIQRENPEIHARFGPGSIVGGAAALSFATQQYTAEAESRAVVLEIRREELIDTLEDHVEMIHAMFAGLGAERERLMNERARLGKLGSR